MDEYVQELQHRIQSVIDAWGPGETHLTDTDYKEEIGKIRKEIVNFHGEMVLLLNYSNINYTGECTFRLSSYPASISQLQY